jgi:hypothetical protein
MRRRWGSLVIAAPTSVCGFLGLAVLVTISLTTGCRSGRTVLPLHIDDTALVSPRDGRGLTTNNEAAVRGIAAILVHDLGLPMPARVTVYLYSSRPVFEQGLIEDGRVSPVRAAELSDFAVGVGKRRQLLLHDEGPRSDREWLRLIAHELTHVSQIELAQGEGRAEQWLAEGMAEWVAFSVLERLSLDTLRARRQFAIAGVRRHAGVLGGRLDLETLGNPRSFTVRHLKEGSQATYQLAFLMVDYLIARDGFERVVDYFRACADSADRHANFRRAFGQELDEFEREILARLTTSTH